MVRVESEHSFADEDQELLKNGSESEVIVGPDQVFYGWKLKHPSSIKIWNARTHDVKSLQEAFEANENTLDKHATGIKVQDIPNNGIPDFKLHLTSRDVLRWKMVANAKVGYRLGGAFRARIADWPDIDRLDFWSFLGFASAALIYGGLHALAWSAHFQSPTQRLLWRIFSCSVMAGLPFLWPWYQIRELVRGYIIYHTNLGRTVAAACSSFSSLVFILLLLLYILVRAYLVVECFTNLFNLPAGVFDETQWSAYFPHIS